MAEYRIDDLARAAGTSVRNVRVYQDRGILPAPLREGRVAIYTEAHLGRLRLIMQMLGRGYAFAQIKEMIDAWEAGRDLADLLGLEEALTEPWSDEVPTQLSLVDLARTFGRHATPRNLKRALDLGILTRRGTALVAQSPRLLHTAKELLDAGIPPSRILDVAEALRAQTDAIATLFVDLARRDIIGAHGPDWVPTGTDVQEYTALTKRLRPLAQSATASSLAISMTNAFAGLLDERVRALLDPAPGGDDHA